jgi:ubiquinone/menaquinone biosynthesis C-methylase UbiE
MTDALDIGCGTLTSHTARGNVNIDLTRRPKNRPENFVCGDANHLPFKNESFDKVSFYEVIEHVENPSQCIREITRTLKSDGSCEVSTPNPTHWRILLRHLLHRRYVPWIEHIAMWGIPELENLLRTCGLRVVEEDYVTVKEREKFDRWTHRIADGIVHKLSLCHALTGRSVWVKAVKVNGE